MTSGDQERAIIIGAGPAGLTAAFELLTRTGIKTHRPREERLHWRHRPDGELQGQPHRHRRASLLLKIRPCHGLVAEYSSPADIRKDSGYDPVPRYGASRYPLSIRSRHRFGGPRDAVATSQVPHLLHAPLLRIPNLVQLGCSRQNRLLAGLQNGLELYR